MSGAGTPAEEAKAPGTAAPEQVEPDGTAEHGVAGQRPAGPTAQPSAAGAGTPERLSGTASDPDTHHSAPLGAERCAPPDPAAGGGPPVRQCRFCRSPMTPHQAARGICGAPACEAKMVQAAARNVFQRSWGDYVARQRLAFETAADQVAAAVGALGEPAEAIAFGAVPHQAHPVVPQPSSRRDAFAGHLDRIVAEAFARGEPNVDLARRAHDELDEHPVIDATCATCRGKCCFLGGGQDAFLTADTIQLFRQRNPDATPEGIIAHFLGRLPAEAVQFSCVYHGQRGCVLTRFERADICNRYHCNPQSDLLRRFKVMKAKSAVIVGLDDDAGPNVGIYDAAGWRAVTLEGQPQPLAPRDVGDVVATAIGQVPPDMPGDAAPRPVLNTCAWCGAAIDRHRAVVRRSCGRAACERRRLAEAGAEIDRRREVQHAALVRRMREHHEEELERLAAENGVAADRVALGVLPDGDRPLEPLPEARRAAFEAHLDSMIAAAWAEPPGRGRLGGDAGARPEALAVPAVSGAEHTPHAAPRPHPLAGTPASAGTGAEERLHALAEAPGGELAEASGGTVAEASDETLAEITRETALGGAACSICRGSCCHGGGDVAYLSERTLLRVRRETPFADPAAVRARYLGKLPHRSVSGSCVFHGAAGCTLPRRDRSDTCNAFRCQPLVALLRDAHGTALALLIAAGDDESPRRISALRQGAASPPPDGLVVDA